MPDWFVEFDQRFRWWGFVAYLVLLAVFWAWVGVRHLMRK